MFFLACAFTKRGLKSQTFGKCYFMSNPCGYHIIQDHQTKMSGRTIFLAIIAVQTPLEDTVNFSRRCSFLFLPAALFTVSFIINLGFLGYKFLILPDILAATGMTPPPPLPLQSPRQPMSLPCLNDQFLTSIFVLVNKF